MAKTEIEVLAEWAARGWLAEAEIQKNEAKYLSFIEQAKSGILAECNIPHNTPMPDGLFYAWVDIAWEALRAGGTDSQGLGTVKSISEGDTTVTFAAVSETTGTEAIGRSISSHSAELNRFRRISW